MEKGCLAMAQTTEMMELKLKEKGQNRGTKPNPVFPWLS